MRIDKTSLCGGNIQILLAPDNPLIDVKVPIFPAMKNTSLFLCLVPTETMFLTKTNGFLVWSIWSCNNYMMCALLEPNMLCRASKHHTFMSWVCLKVCARRLSSRLYLLYLKPQLTVDNHIFFVSVDILQPMQRFTYKSSGHFFAHDRFWQFKYHKPTRSNKNVCITVAFYWCCSFEMEKKTSTCSIFFLLYQSISLAPIMPEMDTQKSACSWSSSTFLTGESGWKRQKKPWVKAPILGLYHITQWSTWHLQCIHRCIIWVIASRRKNQTLRTAGGWFEMLGLYDYYQPCSMCIVSNSGY